MMALKKTTAGPKSPAKSGPAKEPLRTPLKTDADARPAFPIVGIGASAGGLEAFEQFFSNMPPGSGMAFVVVPHLDPSHASMMTDLLRRVTKMEVTEAEQGVRVKPGHVYVIPPNTDLAISRGALKLEAPTRSHGLRLPIDSFFRSLAQDQGDNAICIIFSGTGSDGTLGMRAVHGSGGMSIVQDPATARYAGMPSSAIQTGLADLVLPVDKMAEHLMNYVRQFVKKRTDPSLSQKKENALRRVLSLIRAGTGHDFSLYKRNTLFRRLEKRMNLHQVEDMAGYVAYLQDHPDELQLIFKDLLIGVTNFFRDPEAFDALSKKTLPGFLADKPDGYSLRVWVTACSTGEEAYSLAMIISECLDRVQRDINVQVFGTDIDENAVAVARSGFYSNNIVADVSPDRLRRFFIKEENGYRIKKEIRDMVVFALQDLAKDPPFTKLDLLSCRNLLIYLEPELQNRLLPVFHYSLKTGGILFLGTSETIGKYSDLFDLADKKWKIYTAKRSPKDIRDETYLNVLWPGQVRPETEREQEERRKAAVVDLPSMAQRALINAFAPPSVILDEKGNILYIHGQTGRYLEPAPGSASLNIQDMAREGIRFELRTAIHSVLINGKERHFQGLRLKSNGGEIFLNLTVRPLAREKDTPGLVLVTFEEVPPPITVRKGKGRKARPAVPSKRVDDLEQELAYTRESLQSSIEELQASNEELKSTNEELQSTNEEFQSTNEELETSREELQSVNEELVTLNSELQAKIDQLTQTENDMRILLDNTRIGIIFLDKKLRIQRFTVEATKVFNLIPTDVGRPITDIRSQLEIDNLTEHIRRVSETLQPLEYEVLARDRTSFLMRIIPYRTAKNEIVGVILTFTDVSQLKRPSLETVLSKEASDYAENIVQTVRHPLVVLDEEMRIISANDSFFETFGLSREGVKNRKIFEIGNREWDIPALKKLIVNILPGDKTFDNFEVERDFPGVGHKRMLFNARKIIQKESVEKPMILLAIEDLADAKNKKPD